MAPRPTARLLLLLAAALAAGAAQAHQARLSSGALHLEGGRVHAVLRFAAKDLRAAGLLDETAAPGLAAALAGPAGAELLAGTVGRLELRTSGPCALTTGATASAEDEDGLALRAEFSCPLPADRLVGTAAYLDRLGPSHTELLQVFIESDGPHDRVLQAAAPGFSVVPLQAAASAAARFFLLGIEHIFTGLDHIAFLIALLLLGGGFVNLVKVVTSFTVAHSATLGLAALGVLVLSPRIVEPLIAASIVAVAAENLWALRHGPVGTARALRHRWAITFAFGLVHGFGFAGALREAGLPHPHLALSLACFNLGVEAGQVCIVAAALPLLGLLWRSGGLSARGTQALSAALGLLGLAWMARRLLGG